MKKSLLMIVLLALLPFSAAFAVKLTGLFQANVVVNSQSDEELAQGIKKGFQQVLVKLTGDTNVMNRADMKASLNKVNNYVQEYNYAAPPPNTEQPTLQIRFDKNGIISLLKSAGVGYWGENRPLILVWLAASDSQHPDEIIGNEEGGELLYKMNLAASQYGLPVIFPVLDMADVSQVTVKDVTGMVVPILADVGKRYEPDALLIGRIEQTNDGFTSHWQLVFGDNQWKWSFKGNSSDEIIDAVFKQASQDLGKQFIVKDADAQQRVLHLQVSNITQRSDLTNLMRYLKQFALVQKVQLSQVSGDEVELAVQLRGSISAFQQNASIGRHLMLKSQDEPNSKLVYQWVH